ncbi:helix-turn-helix transcriptional regulator [Luteococcus sp. H138]|uniref:helix-turn-helix domain-containing protein n=1 Tax=unclassified Luteococcus TaxID=2639923 RepID=UPI00313CEA26
MTPTDSSERDHGVEIHLDEILEARGMTLTELASRAGTTLVNLSVLKNGRARAIRFTSLTAICRALDCQPGDILTVRRED